MYILYLLILFLTNYALTGSFLTSSLMGIHFPLRCTGLVITQLDAPFLLPREVGNESGEIDVAERRIRLIKKDVSGGGASRGEEERPPTHPVFGGMLAPKDISDDETDSDSERDILDSNDVSFRVAKTETETEKRLDALNIKVRNGSHAPCVLP